MNSNSQTVVVCGTIEALKFHNAENGYTIARLRLEDDTHIFVSGYLLGSAIGERIEAEGVWVKHSARTSATTNGWHVDIKRYALLPHTNLNDLSAFLSTGIIAGITPELAARMVEMFGLDTFNIIEQSPKRLKQVKGISAKRIQQIQNSWKARQRWNQLRMLLQTPNMPRAIARRIYQAYSKNELGAPTQSSAANKALLRELYAIDFASAEQIAQVLGVSPNSATRIEYGVRQVLKEFSEQGHVHVPRSDLVRQCAQLLGSSEKLIQGALRRLARTRELVVENERIYRSELFAAEVAAAERLQQLLATRKSRLSEFSGIEWSKTFNWLAFNAKIVLTNEQQTAVQTALTSKISILTGGPGTGKTTTIRAIVALLKKHDHTFLLTAPTARAAKRLSEASGAPAQTLHRLLQFKLKTAPKNKADGEKKFARGRTSPLAADLIIIDECSMLDLLLLNDLLQSINPASHILFVGDPHQLPSIGAGKVLQDLIDSKAIPVITLNAVLRQAKNSLIVVNAHRIQQGKLPQQEPRVRDFLMVAEKDPKRAVRRIVDLVANKLPERFGFDPLQDIQVLCPMNHGPAGVVELNRALQAALNPPRSDKPEYAQSSRTLRVGDKVAQTRNDYERGVFNGDIGRIVAMDEEKQMLTVAFEELRVEYLFSELDQLAHAFALSVHKSQGSEYPAVVILMLNTHGKLLQRNLLYTAVTRARELTVLVATPTAIARAVRNNQLAHRHSHLAPRLAQQMRDASRVAPKPTRKARRATR